VPLLGNVKTFFGADDSGTNDSSSAFQDWADSDYAGFVPPGTYKINSTVTIQKCCSMTCFGGSMATGWDDGTGEINAAKTYQQARFITDNTDPDFNMFQEEKEQIWWDGGCFDFQNLTNHSGAAFYLPLGWYKESAPFVRAEGWGGGIKNITVLGNVDTLLASTVANPIRTRAIHIHHPLASEYPPGEDYRSHINAFLESYFFRVQGLGLKRVIQHDPRILLPATHWSNTHYYDVRAHHCHTSIWDEGGKGTEFHVRHTSGPVFGDLNTAQNTPSIMNSLELNMYIHPQFNDFRDDQDGSNYYNQKTIRADGQAYIYGLSQDDYDRRINIVQGPTIRMFNSVQFREGAGIV
jgi:hypothetical protein